MKHWWQSIKATLGLNRVGVEDSDAIRRRLLEADFGHEMTEQLIAEWSARAATEAIHNQETFLDIFHDLFRTMLPNTEPTLIPGEIISLWGVNGVGKTTSAAKIAYYLKQQGYSTLLAACDTFRSAAREQLAILAERADVGYITTESQDPASVAFDAYRKQRSEHIDFCIIDTAGRVHHHQPLQEQSKKMLRVLQKQEPNAPEHRWIVLDAHLGHNSLEQVRCFHEAVDLNGIILTKWDGTAKAGIITRIVDEFKLPIYFIGTGEQLEDLEAFSSEKYIQKILS